jgi:hypothetical protein
VKGASTGQATALPVSIRLSRKGLPATNALAYYEKSELTSVKSFITLAADHFPGWLCWAGDLDKDATRASGVR